MSKKLASGAQAILLDVKCGLGAFMTTLTDARSLGKLMVSIANQAGRKAVALLSDINQPLGVAVGNALELMEAIKTLKQGGSDDFKEYCIVVASPLLILGGIISNLDDGRILVEEVIESGKAWRMLRDLVIVQGGDVSFIDYPEKLSSAHFEDTILTNRPGYLKMIHARIIDETVILLGGEHAKKGDPIDSAVGILVHNKVGDQININDPILIFVNQEEKLLKARTQLIKSLEWSEEKVKPLPQFFGVVQ